MVRPQERLQIALVVRAAFRQWNAMIYFVGGIEQETAALWVLRVDTAARTPPLLRSRDLFGLEGRDALPSRSGRYRAARPALAWLLWQVAGRCGASWLRQVVRSGVLAEQQNGSIQRTRC